MGHPSLVRKVAAQYLRRTADARLPELELMLGRALEEPPRATWPEVAYHVVTDYGYDLKELAGTAGSLAGALNEVNVKRLALKEVARESWRNLYFQVEGGDGFVGDVAEMFRDLSRALRLGPKRVPTPAATYVRLIERLLDQYGHGSYREGRDYFSVRDEFRTSGDREALVELDVTTTASRWRALAERLPQVDALLDSYYKSADEAFELNRALRSMKPTLAPLFEALFPVSVRNELPVELRTVVVRGWDAFFGKPTIKNLKPLEKDVRALAAAARGWAP